MESLHKLINRWFFFFSLLFLESTISCSSQTPATLYVFTKRNLSGFRRNSYMFILVRFTCFDTGGNNRQYLFFIVCFREWRPEIVAKQLISVAELIVQAAVFDLELWNGSGTRGRRMEKYNFPKRLVHFANKSSMKSCQE